MDNKLRYYEESSFISVSPNEIFTYADNHANFSSHMNKPSWMMGGGSMITKIDDGKGKKVGSHIQMSGKVLGISLFLDEVVTVYEPPFTKAWQTVGDIQLLVIGHYRLGFEIKPHHDQSRMKVYIDYHLPELLFTRLLGYVFGPVYAKWCVRQMITGVVKHFNNKE